MPRKPKNIDAENISMRDAMISRLEELKEEAGGKKNF